jgi:phenylalanyl-tRNA synthetase alpha subunit
MTRGHPQPPRIHHHRYRHTTATTAHTRACLPPSLRQRSAATGERPFAVFDDLSPIVSKSQNFDELLIPPDHVSRRPSDTFYIDADRLLRCHTSAHQNELLRAGHKAFLCA